VISKPSTSSAVARKEMVNRFLVERLSKELLPEERKTIPSKSF
jgi:hypothetical protein